MTSELWQKVMECFYNRKAFCVISKSGKSRCIRPESEIYSLDSISWIIPALDKCDEISDIVEVYFNKPYCEDIVYTLEMADGVYSVKCKEVQ